MYHEVISVVAVGLDDAVHVPASAILIATILYPSALPNESVTGETAADDVKSVRALGTNVFVFSWPEEPDLRTGANTEYDLLAVRPVITASTPLFCRVTFPAGTITPSVLLTTI